jgi:hypothetical protein
MAQVVECLPSKCMVLSSKPRTHTPQTIKETDRQTDRQTHTHTHTHTLKEEKTILKDLTMERNKIFLFYNVTVTLMCTTFSVSV